MNNRTKNFQNCLGVFQGGGCKGIAFAGAYEEAVNRGVFFSEIVGTSAGSILAAFVGAGATPAQLNKIIKNVKFDNFKRSPQKIASIAAPNFWNFIPTRAESTLHEVKNFVKYLGLYNSEYINEWVNEELQKLLNKEGDILFKDLLIPTSVIATDIKIKGVKVWSSKDTPDAKVGLAVQTSCSIPFYFQPCELQYVDGGLLSNLPSFILDRHTVYDKILAFSFVDEQKEYTINGARSFFNRLINTTIDGATDIQLRMQPHIHLIKIDTGDIQATDFLKINEESIKYLIANGQLAAKKFFDSEVDYLEDKAKKSDVAYDIFQSFNFMIRASTSDITCVYVSDKNTRWVYSLFPLLVKWVHYGAKVKVLVEKESDDEIHGDYRKRLLSQMNIEVFEAEIIPFEGIVFEGPETSISSAVILNRNQKSDVYSNYYDSEHDFDVITLLKKAFLKEYSATDKISSKIQITKATIDEYEPLLRRIKQYADAAVLFSIEEIDIESITLMTKYVKGYKFRLMQDMYQYFSVNGIELCNPAKFIFSSQKKSLITPPIVEKRDNKYVLIEGNARLVLLYKLGFKMIPCIVVKNVVMALPTKSEFNIKQVLITDKDTKGSSRYDKLDYELFRKIEEAIHDPNISLK